MSTRYVHTNIISSNWELLADFYIHVFDCKPVPPIRNHKGEWLEQATGVKKANLQGMHLRLPGQGENGPTLEIYSYDKMIDKHAFPAANRKGFGHLAFEVDSVEKTLEKIISHRGNRLGEIVTRKVEGVGIITFVYATDPENNILEVQNWEYI